MADIAAVALGYGSTTSRNSLVERGLKKSEIQIVPVLFKPGAQDEQIYRSYGVPAGTGFDALGVPAERITLGIYEPKQLPSGLFVPESYELSGIVVPMTQDDLDKLTTSENASAQKDPMYTMGALPAKHLSTFCF